MYYGCLLFAIIHSTIFQNTETMKNLAYNCASNVRVLLTAAIAVCSTVGELQQHTIRC